MQKTSTKWLIAWGTEGVEALVDIEQEENKLKMQVAEKLAAEDPKKIRTVDSTFKPLQLRFRMNSHRNIEAYLIRFAEPIGPDNLQSMIESGENFKDLIRNKGIRFAY